MRKFDPQRFRSAVRTIALYRAKQAVRDQIRATGEKLAQFSARDITLRAEAFLAQHMEELITAAAREVATFPEFARFDIGSVWKVAGIRTLPQRKPQITQRIEHE